VPLEFFHGLAERWGVGLRFRYPGFLVEAGREETKVVELSGGVVVVMAAGEESGFSFSSIAASAD
jgi:hypothetical protein